MFATFRQLAVEVGPPPAKYLVRVDTLRLSHTGYARPRLKRQLYNPPLLRSRPLNPNPAANFAVLFPHLVIIVQQSDQYPDGKTRRLHIISLACPQDGTASIRAFGLSGEVSGLDIQDVQLLGSNQKVDWLQTTGALNIRLPQDAACKYGFALRVKTAHRNQ